MGDHDDLPASMGVLEGTIDRFVAPRTLAVAKAGVWARAGTGMVLAARPARRGLRRGGVGHCLIKLWMGLRG
jgi:hypothetical protein